MREGTLDRSIAYGGKSKGTTTSAKHLASRMAAHEAARADRGTTRQHHEGILDHSIAYGARPAATRPAAQHHDRGAFHSIAHAVDRAKPQNRGTHEGRLDRSIAYGGRQQLLRALLPMINQRIKSENAFGFNVDATPLVHGAAKTLADLGIQNPLSNEARNPFDPTTHSTASPQGQQEFRAGSDLIGRKFEHLLDRYTRGNNPYGGQPKILHEGPSVPLKVFLHGAREAVNLPAGTVAAGYETVKKGIVEGDPIGALKPFADQALKVLKDPAGEFVAHPLTTSFIARGAVMGGARVAGAAARKQTLIKGVKNTAASQKLGELASTQREVKALGISGLEHHQRYSPNPITKYSQVRKEKARGKTLEQHLEKHVNVELPRLLKRHHEDLKKQAASVQHALVHGDQASAEAGMTMATRTRDKIEAAQQDQARTREFIKSGEARNTIHDLPIARLKGMGWLSAGDHVSPPMTRLINEHTDYLVDRLEERRRINRGQALRDLEQLRPRLRGDHIEGTARLVLPHDAAATRVLPFIVDKTIKRPDTAYADLKARLDMLKDEEGNITHHDQGSQEHARAVNQANQRRIEKVLADKRLWTQSEKVAEQRVPTARTMRAFKAAEKFAAKGHEVDAELVHLGHLMGDQAEKAKLIPYAIMHQGAHYDPSQRPTAQQERYEALQAEEASHQATLNQAQRDLTKATIAHATAEGALRAIHAKKGRGKDELPMRQGVKVTDRASLKVVLREHQAREALDVAKRHHAAVEEVLHETVTKRQRAKPDGRSHYTTGLVGPDGHPLTLDAIREHYADNAHGKVGFVSHQDYGSRAFYEQQLDTSRRPLGPKARTGEAYRQGTFHHSFEQMAQSHVHAQALVDAIKGMNEIVDTFGTRRPDGGYFRTYAQAQDGARRIMHGFAFKDEEHAPPRLAHVPGLVPMRVAHMYETATRLEQLKEHLDPGSLEEYGHRYGANLRTAFDAPKDHDAGGAYVLVPEAVAKRLQQHLDATRMNYDAGRLYRTMTQQFRRTVLPLSTRWLAGNIIEGTLRTISNGVGIAGGALAFKTYHEVMQRAKELDPEGAQKAYDLIVSGGIHKAGLGRDIVSQAYHYDHKFLADLVDLRRRFVHGDLKGRPIGLGFHALGLTWDVVRKLIMRSNARFEDGLQAVALGKELRREIQGTLGSWDHALAKGRGAIDDAARGLLNTGKQHQYARAVDDVIGRYKHLSPGARRALQKMPFYRWYVNALRFVYVTLPRDRPVQTGFLAGNFTGQEEDLKRKGLMLPWGGDFEHSYLMGEPTSRGGKVPLARYTPFGAVTGTPIAGLPGLLFPQGAGAYQALGGNDWTGNSLNLGDSRSADAGDALLAAANSMFESLLPGVRVARTIAEGGAKAYSDSSIFHIHTKTPPGSAAAGINKWLDPFTPYKSASNDTTGAAPPAGPRGGGSGGGYKVPGTTRKPFRIGGTTSGPYKVPGS